jgi:hypothetical protein
MTTEVKWMREVRSRIAHGFLEVDLSVGFERIEPVAPCGGFRVTDLQEDELAQRCAACVRALQGQL